MDYALYKKIIHNVTSLKSIVELKVTCKMPYLECETDINELNFQVQDACLYQHIKDQQG